MAATSSSGRLSDASTRLAPSPDTAQDLIDKYAITEQAWPQEVSSYAIDDGTRLLLFDPLAVPVALLALAREREHFVKGITRGGANAWSEPTRPASGDRPQ